MCVCVCVCPLALSRLNCWAYGHEIWYRDWPWQHLGRVQWSRSWVKGQGHQVQKRYFHGFLIWVNRYKTDGFWCNVMTSCDVMVWRCDVMAWRHDVIWHRFGTREVQKHFSGFLFLWTMIQTVSGNSSSFYWQCGISYNSPLRKKSGAKKVPLTFWKTTPFCKEEPFFSKKKVKNGALKALKWCLFAKRSHFH